MSHLMKGKTEFRDRATLVDGLVSLGFSRDHIEVHDEPQLVHNYYGQLDSLRANVIIRNRHAPGVMHREDLAWSLEPDGTYSMIVDDMTHSGSRYGAEWQRGLKQAYGVQKATSELAKLGLRGEAVRLEDGRIAVRARVTQARAGLRGG